MPYLHTWTALGLCIRGFVMITKHRYSFVLRGTIEAGSVFSTDKGHVIYYYCCCCCCCILLLLLVLLLMVLMVLLLGVGVSNASVGHMITAGMHGICTVYCPALRTQAQREEWTGETSKNNTIVYCAKMPRCVQCDIVSDMQIPNSNAKGMTCESQCPCFSCRKVVMFRQCPGLLIISSIAEFSLGCNGWSYMCRNVQGYWWPLHLLV